MCSTVPLITVRENIFPQFHSHFPTLSRETIRKQNKNQTPISSLISMADWSQLPKDLLDLIAKHLDSPFYQLNKLRLRSVCSSWRSSISDHLPRRRRLPFLPNDGFITTHQSTFAFHLSKRTVFLITLPTDNSNSWLIKTEEHHPSQMQLLNPLLRTQIKSLPLDSPKVINLLNFRILELGHEYVLHYMNFKPFGNSSLGDVSSLYMEKVVYICLGSENETNDFALLTIHVSGKLAMFKSGNKNWCIIDDMPSVHDVLSPYDDVALFRGEFYAVDNTGRTVLVGLSSNLSLVAGSVFGGDKKFLVESVGQLLLVDMYLSAVFDDVDGGAEDVDEAFLDGIMGERTVRFKVFELDWEGKKWVEVKSLGDRVLFLGDNCTFSALASVLSGCKGNCIFFTGNFNRNCEEGGSSDGVFRNREIGVCDLDNGSIKPLGDYPEYSKLFWPPPAWVASTTLGVQNEFEELRL